ncbi:MAG TPA: peptidase A24 [Bifidobacterium sp.]|nr:peptidase A24 [Bifidobacterium sp.]
MQLVDYLNGMWYMICLPSLLCGLLVSAEDVRSRRVPRVWIGVGCLLQILANLIYALSANSLFLVLQSLLFAFLAAALQCGLALAKPGNLGFGDVTATLLVGLAVGMFGLRAMVGWWIAMSLIGFVWIKAWLRFDPQRDTRFAGRTPFAPAIVAAGAISVIICAFC